MLTLTNLEKKDNSIQANRYAIDEDTLYGPKEK